MTEPTKEGSTAQESAQGALRIEADLAVPKDRLVQPSGPTNGSSAPVSQSTPHDHEHGFEGDVVPRQPTASESVPPASMPEQQNRPHSANSPRPSQPYTTNGVAQLPTTVMTQNAIPSGSYNPLLTTAQEQRFTSEEKGKGRAPAPVPAPTSYGNGTTPTLAEVADAEGRGKREKKKRRLSATGEIDPSSIQDDQAKRKKKEEGTTRPQSSTPAPPSVPLSSEDKAYFDRVEANKSKPPLSDMRGPCPVWSNTRKGLQSAVEYLRNPTRTGGASVDIGPGGKARGVILEGQAPTDLDLWTIERSRTLLLPIGRPRARRRTAASSSSDEDASQLESQTQAGPVADGLGQPVVDSSTALPATKAQSPREPESREVEALLMTHRARIPIALTVAQDYSGVPFRVPRPFIALGWFWIVDAWLEPVVILKAHDSSSPPDDHEVDTDRVVWRFRFEHCGGQQGSPWWQSSLRLFHERQCPSNGLAADSQTWSVVSPDISPTNSLRPPAPSANGVQSLESQVSRTYHCSRCDYHSLMVYERQSRCLNESCEQWAREALVFREEPSRWHELFQPPPTTDLQRITPEALRLTLRPPEPTDVDTRAMNQQVHAGQEYWAGWVCHKCGSANERKKWHGWSCDACKRTLVPRHLVYSDSSLRAPLRPVSTGPRQDDGLASWPFEASFAWTLFEDDVKVVRHGVEEGFGSGTAIYHSLNHEGPKLSQRRINASTLFRDLQRRAELSSMTREMPYRRHIANPQAARPAERYLSPFYTALFGPEPVPEIDSLPAGRPIPWREADEVFLNLADYINERAGQIFPGEAERFNSLLVTVNPPELSASQAPRIFVPAHAFTSFAFFGSDGVLKVRRPAGTGEGKSRQGQMTLQHGDIVGVQTGAAGLEISAHQDGFGFLCIGRQIYQTENDPIARTASPATASIAAIPSRKPPNKPPPRPAKLPHVPLTYWYVGPFPLDPERPLKVHPALRERDVPVDLSKYESEFQRFFTGMEVQTEEREPPKRLDPPVRPGEGSAKKRKPTGGSEGSDKGNTKSARRKSVPAKLTKEGGESKAGSSPAKKKARKSTVS